LPRPSAEQQAEVAARVEEGADLKRDGVVRWRRVDLQRWIQRSFGVSLHERTVGKLLHTLSFRRLTVRPLHPKNDPDSQRNCRAAPQRGGSSGNRASTRACPAALWKTSAKVARNS
jgi:hypothetical protein